MTKCYSHPDGVPGGLAVRLAGGRPTCNEDRWCRPPMMDVAAACWRRTVTATIEV